jgi:hypothetical protein
VVDPEIHTNFPDSVVQIETVLRRQVIAVLPIYVVVELFVGEVV